MIDHYQSHHSAIHSVEFDAIGGVVYTPLAGGLGRNVHDLSWADSAHMHYGCSCTLSMRQLRSLHIQYNDQIEK